MIERRTVRKKDGMHHYGLTGRVNNPFLLPTTGTGTGKPLQRCIPDPIQTRLTRVISQHADVKQREKMAPVPMKRASKRPRTCVTQCHFSWPYLLTDAALAPPHSRAMPGRPRMLAHGTQYRKTRLEVSPVPSRNFLRAAGDGGARAFSDENPPLPFPPCTYTHTLA